MKKITVEDKGFRFRVKQHPTPAVPRLAENDEVEVAFTMHMTWATLHDEVIYPRLRAYMVQRLETQLDQLAAEAQRTAP